MIAHRSPISGIAANATHVVTGGYDNVLISWVAGTKIPVARASHDHLVNHCSLSGCGEYLISASSDHSARVWRLPELQLLAVLPDHDDDVEMAVLSPDGQWIATASRDTMVRVFDRSGKLHRTLVGHEADVISVAWSPDNRTVISSSDDGTVRKWDWYSGKESERIDLGGVETDTFVIGADDVVYAGNDRGEIAIAWRGQVYRHAAHDAGIKRLLLNDKRAWLVSLSYDGTLKVWRVLDGTRLELLRSSQLPLVVWARAAAFKEDTLVFGTFGTSYAGFSVETGDWDLTGVTDTQGINAICLVDGRTLTVGDAGVVRSDDVQLSRTGSLCNFIVAGAGSVLTGGQSGEVFDGRTGRVICKHRSPLNCAASYEVDGEQKVIIGTYTGEGLVLSRGSSGDVQLERVIPLHANAVKGVAACAGVIFSVGADGAAAFHHAHDTTLIRKILNAHDKIANGCAALAGEGFASVSRDRCLRLWRLDGSLDAVIVTPHTHSFKCIAASADGRHVATASYNGRVAVFDRSTRTWVIDRRMSLAGISSIAAFPGGFSAASYLGDIHDARL